MPISAGELKSVLCILCHEDPRIIDVFFDYLCAILYLKGLFSKLLNRKIIESVMQKMLYLCAVVMVSTSLLKAQTKEFYASSSAEFMFSFANVDYRNQTEGGVVRFAPVFNWQSLVNYDFTGHFGLFSGLSFRNVGFIYQFQGSQGQDTIRKKFRSYNLGIPVGIKVGNLKRFHVYGGYEFEFPFNYKEKTFEGDRKTDKFVVWFGKRTTNAVHSLFVGLQFPYGTNIKFKYYLTNFHNKGFTDSLGNKPYENLTANVFYISLNFFLFKNTDLYYKNYYKGTTALRY